MQELKHRRWLRLFLAVSFVALLQVAWWATVFWRDVGQLQELRYENARLRETKAQVALEDRASIQRESFHRRLMFLSESVFFALSTCLGLYLLYRALKAEERTRETQRNFIETVTHESKTPLTALKLRLESLLEKAADEPERHRELSSALAEVRRLVSIFEKALSLNRVERQVWDFEILPLADVVRQVARRLEPFLRGNAVHLSLDLDAEALVRGDAYGLQNSVQSLLENAVLYNDKAERHVTVSLKSDLSRVRMEISDNGPGVDFGDRTKVFDRFYRGRSGSRVPGTGLGLYIAKTIIEAHQGLLRLKDMTGPGACFEIELPRATETLA